MGHRLSRIYTRTGDDGTTGLSGGGRVAKFDARVEAFGSVDETNSAIGLVLSEGTATTRLADALMRIQHELFEAGAELSMPEYRGIAGSHVEQLEADIDALNA
jgi:cob(I)alamin adenosyltransferase